ncbi:hypothetical protein [Flavobacterium nackdongense]|uniref:Uncharacterized protein n=1 Tax=Flavobacterium nackdongense TaxID=2547394 RepID=A0A4P6YHF1_9FLAO|nr:hypothetical protein [Flavobacterium nackdongense]QBN19913.1 hypothetical protein E1750_14270 [Flavobacterium nackdongense]
MKKILLTFVLIVTSQFTLGQNAIAKLKFSEAEEAYAVGDYELTISKLNEAERILKSTNPKILYLKIVAQFDMIEKKTVKSFSVIVNTRSLTKKYLNQYQNLSNIEDKYREVYKIDKALKNYPQTSQDFEIWKEQQRKAEQIETDNKNLIKSMIEEIQTKYEKYKWKTNLTEEEFLSNNTEIKNYKWDRIENKNMMVVLRHTGTPLSVSGYYPNGPANYVINESGIVTSITYNLKTAKNKTDEMKKDFEEMKSEAVKYGKYYTFKDTYFTISVPKSAVNPNEIAYYIHIQLTQVDKWSFMQISFNVNMNKAN